MLNVRPIFLNALARGGSNILVNFFLSHPEVCISSGEMHKVFKGRARFDTRFDSLRKRLFYDRAIRILSGQNIFNTQLLEPRKHVSPMLMRYIDWIFYQGRFKAMVETHNLYKAENVKYKVEELKKCRLLSKGLNGMVFNTELLTEMYPDAIFIAMVRNGLAVCEGMVRRGVSAEILAKRYTAIVDKMLWNKGNIPNYHLITYEDMVSQPLETIKELYMKAGLDLRMVKKIRLESKAVTDSKGKHTISKGYDREVFWYDKENLHQHIVTNANDNQIKQLRPSDKLEFLKIAKVTMERLGYSIT